ncbi:hypothetical protein BJ508DRAFT_320070 [Ascobolus immersus RN42]|uniref:Uncharacterized protein n=1 Tax=Ascobolus immersus RN42 TaxID=1160509 RepID=A0A3N4IQ91_ASCIM|nr:hypothetical protein BJ508DRAFT_320070 [Ascobolus immersus RN42]
MPAQHTHSILSPMSSIDATTTALQSITLNEPAAPSSHTAPSNISITELHPTGIRLSNHTADSNSLPTIPPNTDRVPAIQNYMTSVESTISALQSITLSAASYRPPITNEDLNDMILSHLKNQRKKASKRKLSDVDSDKEYDDPFGPIVVEAEPAEYYPPAKYASEANYNTCWGIKPNAHPSHRQRAFREIRPALSRIVKMNRGKPRMSTEQKMQAKAAFDMLSEDFCRRGPIFQKLSNKQFRDSMGKTITGMEIVPTEVRHWQDEADALMQPE